MLRMILLIGGLCGGALLLTGCPAAPANVPSELTPTLVATEQAAVAETVTISANLPYDATAANGVSYRWYQIAGREVALSGADTPSISFVAPSVSSDTTLAFRLEITNIFGERGTAEASLMVLADPEYVGGGPGGSGGGGGSGGNSGDDTEPFPQVRLETSLGDIVVELDRDAAPVTVENFLRYVRDGFYDGTIFHRVIADFVVQGGGFEPGLDQKDTRRPIVNESNNGLNNDRGTIAMARTNDPNSATSQFYFNLVDNDSLNYVSSAQPGYCVFGRVIDGLDVVDDIAQVETATEQGFQNVPVDDVILERAVRITRDESSGVDRTN